MQIDFSIEELLEILESIDCYDGEHSGRSEERDSILEKINHCLTEGTNLDMHLDKWNGHYIFRVPSKDAILSASHLIRPEFNLELVYKAVEEYIVRTVKFAPIEEDIHLWLSSFVEDFNMFLAQFVGELEYPIELKARLFQVGMTKGFWGVRIDFMRTYPDMLLNQQVRESFAVPRELVDSAISMFGG